MSDPITPRQRRTLELAREYEALAEQRKAVERDETERAKELQAVREKHRELRNRMNEVGEHLLRVIGDEETEADVAGEKSTGL